LQFYKEGAPLEPGAVVRCAVGQSAACMAAHKTSSGAIVTFSASILLSVSNNDYIAFLQNWRRLSHLYSFLLKIIELVTERDYSLLPLSLFY
jgi:hypothetical protein